VSWPLDQVSSAVLAVTRHLSVREVLQTIVTAARELLDAEYAALGIPDDEGAFAEFLVDGVTEEQRTKIGAMPRQHGLLASMLRDPRPQRLPDVRADPRYEWWPAAHPILKDFLGVPIVDGDEILGAIYLANRRGGGGFTQADERVLGVLAAHAAIALVNARLYEQSRELTLFEERQRIARELHDAVAQKLFGLRLTAEAAATLVDRDPRRAQVELRNVAELAAQATEDLRQVVAELQPRELAEAGLVQTLAARVRLLDRVHTATVALEVSPELGSAKGVKPRVAETVLRIAEEALHNALRHADASRVTVSLSGTPDSGLVLTVADDGVGLPATTDGRDRAQLGLASMRERAERINAKLRISSSAGRGTTIELMVP
jgi:signal transduction histidine kinase